MDKLTINNRQKTLKKEIVKSIEKINFSKNKRLNSVDKVKIKRRTVSAVQNFLKVELKKRTVKTYDCYFFKDINGHLIDVKAYRNKLNENRYFIVDYMEVGIASDYSLASTVGEQRIRQLAITNKEISDIISKSARLFSSLIKITVSEKEDAKIWKAYDTVDEKKVVGITVGFPVIVIGMVEAIPLLVMASKSSATSIGTSVSKAFTVNTGGKMAINGGLEFGSQYLSNGMVNNDWGLSNIDAWDVGVSTIFGKGGDVILGSTADFSFDKGFKINSFNEFSENILMGGAKFKGSKAFNNAVGKPLANFSNVFGKFFDVGGQLTIQTVIEGFRKESQTKE
ncbi:hypothetical protein [Costertonia aggregata]|uniref:Uncharacterized protein n=1 Tax=Costertonia aggregata TaxID=343403 RepID=A0A7H9ATY3_9FLAO|nr:hypothetical protein [Costertonia aggregata]QLG46857.1 hypothetical protein HYG79_16355 [Costertonia aggregata]